MHNDPPFPRGPLPDDDDDQTLRGDGDVNHALPLHEMEDDDDQTLRDGDVDRSPGSRWESLGMAQEPASSVDAPAQPTSDSPGDEPPRVTETPGTVIFKPSTPIQERLEKFVERPSRARPAEPLQPAEPPLLPRDEPSVPVEAAPAVVDSIGEPVEDLEPPAAIEASPEAVEASTPAEAAEPAPVEDPPMPASAGAAVMPPEVEDSAAAFAPASGEVGPGAEPARRGGGKGILLAGVAAIVLILGAGAFFMFANKPADNGASRQPVQAAAPPQPAATSPAAAAAARQPASLTDPSVLYQANWTQGLSGWPSNFGWSAAEGVLKNDGSDFGDGNWMGGLWNVHGVAAPFAPPGGPPDSYAVEAEIGVPSRPACGSFGLSVRGTQQVGIHMCGADEATVLSIRSSTPELLLDTPITVNDGWHLYRVEVRPENTVVLIDGVRVAEVDDESAPASGVAGLWDDHTPIEVRQFQLRKL